MSKLYTEEEVKLAIKKACLMWQNHARSLTIKYVYENVIPKLTPIQLPTDEEVENQASKYSRIESISTQGLAGYYFEMGAKWMRDKIKGGEQ